MSNTDFEFKPLPGKREPDDKALRVFKAAFPNEEDAHLVSNWLQGIELALGIESMFGMEGDKLDRIALTYPMDVIHSLAKCDGTPKGDCLDRLQDRGFIVNAFDRAGVPVILVGIPLDEALRQAKVWADGELANGENITVIKPTTRGVVTGSIETI